MTARTYFLSTVFLTLLSVVMVAGFNYLLDPYGITGSPRIAGLNQYKAEVGEHVRLMKKYNPLQHEHNALIVGNTRAEIGLNPAHHCFAGAGMQPYNLGLPGAPVQMQVLYALNVMYQQPVETVVISLDFIDFLFTRKDNRFGEPPLAEYAVDGLKYNGAGQPVPGYGRSRMLDYFQALFSLDAFLSSVKTVALQGDTAVDRDSTGFNPAREFGEIVRVEGTRAMFDQKAADLREHFDQPWYLRNNEGRIDPSFDDLRDFLDIAMDRGVRVYMLVNPIHQSYWELLEEAGHIHLHPQWLDALDELLTHYPPESVSAWDFSMESPYNQEIVPPAGVKAGPLQWFWELSFFRQPLGDIMLDAVFSESCGTDVAFGSKLQ